MAALAGLDDDQLRAARALRGPVQIIAGAGSGKTTVITRRIAHGVEVGAFSPPRVLALTFTTKAAGVMRGRLQSLGVAGITARTFHAHALAQLNTFWPGLTGGNAPRVIENKVRMLAQAASTLGIRPDTATLRDIAATIEWRKVSMLSLERFASLGRSAGAVGPEKLVGVHEAYEALKDARGELDFEDVLLAAAGMLETEEHIAAQVGEQFRHFTIDEYQDVSPLQDHLLQLWIGRRQDVCVVGDPSQTIYSFAGANQKFLLAFGSAYPEVLRVELRRTYRNSAPIAQLANRLISAAPGQGAGAVALESAREPSVTPPELTVRAYASDLQEAAGVASQVAAWQREGVPLGQIAVLYRTHGQSALVQQALAERGVGSTVLGGKRYFDLPEVKQAVLALRGAAVAPLNTDFLTTVRETLRALGLTAQPPSEPGAVRDAWDARAALYRLAEEYASECAGDGTAASLPKFSARLVERATAGDDVSLDTVTLSTLHAAKGLEWSHVHLLGLSEGLLPIAYARSDEQIAEERRLAYVGITRARDAVTASWAGPGRDPSRFLSEAGFRAAGSHSLRGTRTAAR